MDKNQIQKLKDLAVPVVEREKLFLVDVEIKHQQTPEVWILVDSEENGVNLDLCSKISRKISSLIEEEDLIKHAYRLNVSSPGLSRPLSDFRQYKKNIGRNVKVKFKNVDDYVSDEGKLSDVLQDKIVIRNEDGDDLFIPYDAIVETKIIPKI